MGRPKGHAELQVRIAFEATRTAPQCLAAAYERLVPIPCRPTRAAARGETPSTVVDTAEALHWRRAERE